jgi:hypothetical protein
MREMLCGVDRHAGVIRCRYRRIATAAENRYQPKGQSISPDGTGGFMKKRWVLVDFGECPNCGDDAEILTDCNVDGEFYDGDEARCCQCGAIGQFSCDGEDTGYIIWEDL